VRLPNFLVVGAAKSGTTSLFHYLEQHPEVFTSPVKEPNFLAFPDNGRLNLRGPLDEAGMYRYIHRRTAKSFAAYRELFASASHETAIGEASPRYFYIPHAAARIERYLGAPKIIVILRDPIARAYSHFLMNRRRGLEPLADFRAALAAEPARIAAGWDWDWHYAALGRYHTQLTRFLDRFGADNVLVLLHDDLKRDPVGLTQQVFDFLGVDSSYVPDTRTRHMAGRTGSDHPLARLAFGPENTLLGRLAFRIVPRRLGLRAQNLLQRAAAWLPGAAIPPMPTQARDRLSAELAPEIDRLAGLIGRDLSAWRAPARPCWTPDRRRPPHVPSSRDRAAPERLARRPGADVDQVRAREPGSGEALSVCRISTATR
jgi:Sulfotransferase family